MGIIATLNFDITNRDWRSQVVNGKRVSDIIAKIESGYRKTVKVKIDLEIFDLSAHSFKCDDLFDFARHMKLVEKAELKYPVIVNYKGSVIDGRHRVIKAIMEGKKTINGIMILEDIGED